MFGIWNTLLSMITYNYRAANSCSHQSFYLPTDAQ